MNLEIVLFSNQNHERRFLLLRYLTTGALVAAPTRAPHAVSTSWRQSRVSPNDTRAARLAPYGRVPFNSLFSLANIPDCIWNAR